MLCSGRLHADHVSGDFVINLGECIKETSQQSRMMRKITSMYTGCVQTPGSSHGE
jgi:hypothetical protein